MTREEAEPHSGTFIVKIGKTECLLLLVLACYFCFDWAFAPYAYRGPGPDSALGAIKDRGFVLSVTKALLEGRLLFQGIYWQYGPIPILFYESFARLFGNSPESFRLFMRLLLAAANGLTFFALYRRVSLRAALVLYVMFLYQLDADNTNLITIPFELIFVLCIVLAWRRIAERTPLNCLLYGILFGLLQFSKFGSQLTAGAAFLTIDLLQIAQSKWNRRLILSAIRTNLIILCGYLSVLGFGAGIMLCFLSRRVVLDVLWPVFLKDSYGWVQPGDRYPHYFGADSVTQLPVLMGLAVCGFSILFLLFGRAAPPEDSASSERDRTAFPYALLLPPLIYAFGCVFLFKHVWHFTSYGVFAALGVVFIFRLFGRVGQAFALLLLFPFTFLLPRYWHGMLTEMKQVTTASTFVAPSGQVLRGPPKIVAFYKAYFAALAEKTDPARGGRRGPVAIMSSDPGIYFYSNLDIAGRHAWYFPGWVRPWEEAEIGNSLLGASAIALGFPVGNGASASSPNRAQIEEALPLPEGIRKKLLEKLAKPEFIGSRGDEDVWVFSVLN